MQVFPSIQKQVLVVRGLRHLQHVVYLEAGNVGFLHLTPSDLTPTAGQLMFVHGGLVKISG